MLTCPCPPDFSYGWSGFQKPTGNIVFPSSVTYNSVSYTVSSIGDYAFTSCNGLTGTLTIPNTITSIGNNAFYGCNGFSGTLTLSNTIESIGTQTFGYCTGFTGTLNIPNSVTSIGGNAFKNCSNLNAIELNNSTPPTAYSTSFSGLPTTIPVNIPCGATSTYQAATGWSSFTNYQEQFNYTLTVSSANTNMGNAAISQQPDCNTDAIVTATPNAGYVFVNWTKNGNVVSTEATYNFTVTENTTLVANFDVAPIIYAITASANPTNGGTVSGTGNYEQGANVTLSANANDGYTFVNWTENNTVVSTNPTYSFTVNGNRNLVANFGEPVTDDIFHFTAQTDNVTISMQAVGSAPSVSLQYCTSANGTWQDFIVGTTQVTINQGQKVYIKAKNANNRTARGNDIYNKFVVSNNASLGGNIMYLLDPTGNMNDFNSNNGYAFCQLFNDCKKITDASHLELPATLACACCYSYMFYGCTGLTAAPELPATTLESSCYSRMFYGCTGLTAAPELPAATLSSSCYSYMFYGCTGLNAAPELPATTLESSCYSCMFYGCTGLTAAPELPATTLACSCYEGMFCGCTRLTTAPALPATTLASSCYSFMFSNCKDLTASPELPATTLASSCYPSMFRGCTGLVAAPELPATTMASSCYNCMFYGCNSLTTAPELPATTLESACYSYMFYGCTGLVAAPELPSTTLASYCYYYMFGGCSSLTEAPVLPATTLAENCYYQMFNNCTSLNYVMTYATTWNTSYTQEWLYGIAATGDFYNLGGADVPTGTSGIPTGWTEHRMRTITASVNNSDYGTVSDAGSFVDGEICTLTATPNIGYTFVNWTENDVEVSTDTEYSFTVENDRNLVANFAIQTFEIVASANDEDFGIVTGGGTFDYGTMATLTATPNTGYSFVNWTENNIEVSTDTEYSFTVTGDRSLVANFEADADYFTLTAIEDNTIIGLNVIGSPNISTLQYRLNDGNWINVTDAYVSFETMNTDDKVQFRSKNAISFINPGDNGFYHIRFECDGGKFNASGNINTLINYENAEAIIDLTGMNYCFSGLFENNTGLVSAANLTLPATTLSYGCYEGMFRGCSSLTTAPELPATYLAKDCYQTMFCECSSLLTAPALPATSLADYCYTNMFSGCASLTTAPELPAMSLAENCYNSMFMYCTSLLSAPTLPATSLTAGCYTAMFTECTSLTTAPELPATNLANFCYNSMFYRCVSLTTVPALPATSLENYCYSYTFGECTSLTTAPVLPATSLERACYIGMFMGCTSLTTAPELLAINMVEDCYDEMFQNCTSLKSVTTHAATWNSEYATNWLSGVSDMGDFNNFGGADIQTGVDGIPEGWTEHRVRTIAVSANNSDFGTVSGAGSFVDGEMCTLTATPNTNYTFINWTENDVEVSTDAEYSFTVENDRNLVANFVIQTFEIVASANNSDFGTVTGGGTFDYGTMATLTATPNTGYTFINWTENDIEVSTDTEYSFTVEGDRNLVANFAIQAFEITASANNSDYGTVSGGGTFDYGTMATLTATPNTGYTFINWTENNIEVSTDAEYSFTVEADRNLVANFEVAIDYLTLTALEDNTIVGLNINGTPNISTLQYSYDGVNWIAITESITFNTLQNGEYIKFRSENQVSSLYSNHIQFYDESGSYKVSGNVNTLINYNDVDNVVLGGYAFYNLFSGCTHLTDASSLSLPSVVLSYACYQGMFMGCTSLTEAPELPAMDLAYECYKEFFKDCTSLSVAPTLSATNLEDHCYWGMFDGCTSLVEAPVLPATTMTNGSYHHMFYSCTSLTEAPALPATTLMPSCYGGMFYGCTSLIEAPELPATTLTGWCYKDMFRGCTSLTVAPELPATTLDVYCYDGMFFDCTSLAEAPALPATILEEGCYSWMFTYCKALTEAPVLPATTLADRCYESMFFGCKAITEAPELPATTLAGSCYSNMFCNCSSLTQPPVLPVTNLTGRCYLGMFNGCTSLTVAPELPATTLTIYCYHDMFAGCTSLTVAPELPATTLADGCYYDMFGGCTSLSVAPELPATTLADGCYSGMFSCTSLSVVPELPATTFVNNCYYHMFWGCTSLNSVTTHATTWNTEYAQDWLYGVSVTGDFYNLGGADIPRGASGIPEGWTEHKPNFIDYLTLTATSDNTVIGLDTIGSPNISTLQYSYDGVNWNNVTKPITFNTLQNGEYIKFRSENQVCTANVGSSDYIHHYIQFKDEDGSYKASGNINTLIDYQDVDNVELGIFAFYKMFQDCTRLTDASELLLPSMTMDLYCYQSMFNGCTALTSAPALPAMTMTSGCYLEMFKGCSSLTEAPELPATNLGADCYEEMFKGCTSLTEAPELPATDLGHGCYKEMFKGCTSLMEAPELPATTLAGYCYYYMFSNCVSLTEVPSLPATTLTRGCYYGMFNSCTSLTEAPELPATTLAENCYQGMFYNCTSLTSAPELPATTMAKSCYQSMFSWCSNITSAPALPATTLADYCYTQMFYNCTSLTFAPALPATTLAGHCYSNMFIYCTSLAEASALPATVMADNCYFSMFNGCTSLTSAPALTVMTTASYCCCQMFSGCTGLADASEVSLPAMTMADYCYYNMFSGCRSLTSAPALPATTLADYCYWQMFSNCESLTETPALPATTMAEGCYQSMFNGCESLTEVPALPATMLAESCYQSMFYNCSNLNSTISLPATTLANSCYYKMFYCCHSLKTVITHATTWNAEYAQNWLYDVSATGDFYNLGGADIPRGASGIPEGWTEHTTAPVTITASANNANFGTVSGGGSFVEGETCTLTATPNTGYTFVNWTENNIEVSTDAEYTFTVENDRDLVANFQSSGSGNHWNPDISLYSDNMSVVAEIHIDGVVQTSTDIEIGAFCDDEVRGSRRVEYKGMPFDKYVAFLTIYGESNDNITFKVYDHQNNEELNCRVNQSLTFTPNGTVGNLINPYVIEFFTTANITATANPTAGGTVSGDGVYSVGETVTLTATADEYYRFVNWTENDVEVSTSETYSFTAYDDRNLVANFEIKNHWVPDESLYADNMSIVGEIQIDGVSQTSSDIEIGAFCGEEVRGSQRISYYAAPVDKHLVFLTVYGMSNDNITFRLYNHQTESEYDLTAPEPITFTPNNTVGNLGTPHILNFCHTQSRELTAGWNWYSTFIDIEGEDGFNMLTAGLGEDGLQVKSQSQFALYYPGYDIWTGSLNEADNTKLYMIEMSSPHTLVMTGAFTDVQSTPITINKGWTWIGYPVTESMSLDEATSNINPTNGDYFKSQSGFSIYYEGYGWVGSLNTLEPGRGYMYQNNGESSMNLAYPTPSAKNVLEENITADGNHWVPNAYQYADNMSVIAVININGVEQMSGNLEIGAFSNGECRGSARLIYVEAVGRYMLFMTVYGEGGENLDFRLFDADKNEECQLQAGMDFEPNGTVGNLVNPYVFDLSVMGIGEEQPFAFGFYPNPVSSGKQLAIEGEYDRIEIINSIGVVIGEYTNTNKIEVTMIPGVYYIRAINDKSIIINKLVVK